MLELLRERFGESSGPDYTVDYRETVSAFEALVDSDPVTVDGDASELVERFEAICSDYCDISAEVERAAAEVTEDGEVTLWTVTGNEKLSEWQRENQGVVTEIESLNDRFDRLIEDLDAEDSALDEEGPIAEVNSFYRNLSHAEWLTP